MKIAFFTDTYEPQVNGVVISINRFVKELRRRGHIVYIFSPSSPGYKPDKFVRTFKSIAFRNYPEYRIGIPLIDKFFKKKRFDIVHVHTPATVGLAGVLMAKYHELPLVGTYHTLIPEYAHYLTETKEIKRITKKALWKYSSLFYNNCSCVIAPSEEIRNELKRHDIRKEIAVIPTGIEIKIRRPIRHRGKIILHVGRITKEKNIHFILKALKNVLKEDAKLVITSDGPSKDELVKLSKKLGIERNVIFTGYVSQKNLEELYSKSDLFVMASKSETQGIVLIEAMAFSLPVVVLKSPVIGNFVGRNNIGFVTNEKNFAKEVKKMLFNDKIRKRFIKNCRAVKEYNIRNCTDKLIDVYSELVKR